VPDPALSRKETAILVIVSADVLSSAEAARREISALSGDGARLRGNPDPPVKPRRYGWGSEEVAGVDTVQHWLQGLPPGLVYVVVALVVGVESLGIPLPGEIALVSAALLASRGVADIWWVAIAAALGAIVGDSIGYWIGHKGGRPLLERLGRRFPKHLGPAQLARAEQVFDRWGVWAIFFGRFVALLRILAGPLSGALRISYGKFLIANAAGGIAWGAGTAFVIYGVGRAAERWLSNFSYFALGAAVLGGVVTTLVIRHRARRAFAAEEEREAAEPEPTEASSSQR
jgi:membrane protein DedA with SNARE-associated domain